MPNISAFHQPTTQALTAAGLNLIGQALSIYDNDLRLAVCNARFQQMFELPDALVTPGATFDTTIRHLATRGEYGVIDDIDAFVAERNQQARAFQPHYMERTRITGQTIAVEGAPLPTGGWITVYTDITATKKQETLLRARSEELSDQVLAHTEELASTNRALAATVSALEEAKRHLTALEAQTRLTTEMMPAHIAHVDASGHYTYSNRRLSSVMPGRPSDILGHHIANALGTPVYERIKPQLDQAFGGREGRVEFTDPESARRIRVAFTPDTLGGAYILSTDMTEETQARVALQQSRRRALAAQVTSGMAHDFSNLLTIIMGMQSKLSRLDGMPGEASELIEATLGAAKRGGELLSGIAEMTGQPAPRAQAVKLAGLLSDLKTLAEPSLPAGLRLHIIDDTPDIPVLLDPGTTIDSLLNLILNARDACAEHPTGDITLRTRIVRDTWVEFTVKDTGPGFSPTALQQALDPFFTTKGSDGSGLGLPMVYDMTKLAGGDLRVRNRSEKGAEIRLRLPLRLSTAQARGLALLVEDEEDLRRLYRDLLIDVGYSVIEAASVEEAKTLLSSLPDVTLVLSDIRLGGEHTGLDLLDHITPLGIPMLLMTSLAPNAPQSRQGSAQTIVLRKPFDATALQHALDQKAAQ